MRPCLRLHGAGLWALVLLAFSRVAARDEGGGGGSQRAPAALSAAELPTASARGVARAFGCGDEADAVSCCLEQLYGDFHRRDNWHPTSSFDTRQGLTYGEIEVEGVSDLVAVLELLGALEEGDVLFDLGSGLGKMALQIFLATRARTVVGIEFVRGRVEEGMDAISRLHELLRQQRLDGELSTPEDANGSRGLDFPVDGRSLVAEYGDFLARDLSSATVLYTCSNSFPDSLLSRLSAHLAVSLAVGTVFVSLRRLPQPHPRLTCLFRMKSVHVTWAPHQGLAFVYVVVAPPPPLADIAASVRSHFSGLEEGVDASASALAQSWGAAGLALRRLAASAAFFDKSPARRCRAHGPALDVDGLEAFWCGGVVSKDSLNSVDEAFSEVFRAVRFNLAGDGTRYLPMELRGKRVLVKVGPDRYRVDNSQLASSADGLGHRLSKSVDDVDDESFSEWDSVVAGSEESDGWLRFQGGLCSHPTPGTATLIRDSRGRTLLHEAAFAGADVLIGRLLSLGLPPDAADFDGRAPLHDALDSMGIAKTGPRGLRVLLESRADVNVRDRAGRAPLHTRVGSEELAELLLAGRADANARDHALRTPMHLCPSREFAGVLVKYGAQPSAADAGNSTALHSCTGDPNLASGLLDARAEVNIADSGGNTPLHKWCARRNHVIDGIQALIRHRADVDAANLGGQPPLFPCLQSKGAVDALLQASCRVDVADGSGRTALHEAAASASIDVLRLLLGARADASRLDGAGRAPLDYARGQDKQELLRSLSASEL